MEITQIKEQLSIANVLHYYGLKTDKQSRLNCPFHEDKTPSMQLYYKTQTAYCFSSNCKTHGKSIDIFSNFSVTENKKAGTLNVSGKLTGDNFPSTEAFMTDPNGNNVFIGVGQIAAGVGANTGPFTELPGENSTNPITSFNFTISTDKKGNFTGVTEGKTTYSITDWNKRFTSQSTQKQE